MAIGLKRPFLGVKYEEKEMQTFSSTFGEVALLLDGFLRDIDSRNHAINPSVLGKNHTFKPPPSWCTMDNMTNRQTERALKGRGTYRILRILSVIMNINQSNMLIWPICKSASPICNLVDWLTDLQIALPNGQIIQKAVKFANRANQFHFTT